MLRYLHLRTYRKVIKLSLNRNHMWILKLLASLLHSLSSSSSCQSRKDTVHLISVFVLAQTDNIHEQYCKITVADAFTVQLEYLCYNNHIFWNTYKNISGVNIPHFYYVSRLFMYNQTMIEINISSRGKYLKRIKDITNSGGTKLYRWLVQLSCQNIKESINIVHYIREY